MTEFAGSESGAIPLEGGAAPPDTGADQSGAPPEGGTETEQQPPAPGSEPDPNADAPQSGAHDAGLESAKPFSAAEIGAIPPAEVWPPAVSAAIRGLGELSAPEDIRVGVILERLLAGTYSEEGAIKLIQEIATLRQQ